MEPEHDETDPDTIPAPPPEPARRPHLRVVPREVAPRIAPACPPRQSGKFSVDNVSPTPRLLLRTEPVTFDRSGGLQMMLETKQTPVLELSFDYGAQRIASCDPRSRFFKAAWSGMRVIPRDFEAEGRAGALLESFGALEIACLDRVGVPPGSRAHYLLRLDGDVHDYCGFSAWAVPQLRRIGWTVDVARDYPYRVVDASESEWFARVEPSAERADWFGLHLGIEVNGARINLLPALVAILEKSREGESLSRIARRKRHIALPLADGRFLTVPPASLRGLLGVVSELYDGTDAEPEVLTLNALGTPALARLARTFRGRSFYGRPLRWEGARGPRELGEEILEGDSNLAPPSGLAATLRGYQEEGVAWLQHLRRFGVGGILADDMGLGKTLQTIAHVLIEKEEGRLERPALVVAPTSLAGTWRREIAKFAPSLKTLVLRGPKRHRHYAKIDEVDVVITSYPIVARDIERLAKRAWHLLILDEAQTIKNTASLSHKTARRLAERATHRVCLTGTPVENHLGELWALFDFLNPGMLGDKIGFRRFYRVPIEAHSDEDRLAALRRRVEPYLLRRLKGEVAKELPPKTELLRPVTLEADQRKLYESIRVAAHSEVRRIIAHKGLAASTVPILDALTKLRQVCCDPRLVPLRAARKVRRSAKFELLNALIEAQLGRGHRILVFSQFTRMLSLIARGLDERETKYLMLTGQSRHRQQLVDAFEGGDADVFLISLKAGGVGLTLTRADTVIHYDPWWNPAAQDQATDRAYRIGQTEPVVAYNLFVEGSVEERMLGLQRRKRKLAEGILSGGGGPVALCEAEVEELFAPLG